MLQQFAKVVVSGASVIADRVSFIARRHYSCTSQIATTRTSFCWSSCCGTAEELKQSPSAWMAWNYRDTLVRLAASAAA